MNKCEAYESLVQDAREFYRKHDGSSFLVPLDETFGVCKEINLYTYWQGRGYAEATPEIKYLLVGQDWGNPYSVPKTFQDRISQIISGKDLPYISDEKKMDSGFQTDKNLIELFRHLGYEIAQQRYDELFFTNFCLGYRRKENSRGMKKELMNKDRERFRELCTILQPKNILCLGRMSFECVYKALVKGSRIPYKGYMKYIEEHAQINADPSYGGGVIYPLAHCGGLGIRNRPLEQQIEDWKWVGETSMQ